MILARNMITIVFRIVLPLILQIILSFLLVYKLFKKRLVSDINRSMKKELKFARTIVWLNFFYVITETPLMVTTLYFGIIGLKNEYPISNLSTSITLAIFTLVYYVTSVLGSYMFGFLVFVNFSTNRLFKKEMRLILSCGPVVTQNYAKSKKRAT